MKIHARVYGWFHWFMFEKRTLYTTYMFAFARIKSDAFYQTKYIFMTFWILDSFVHQTFCMSNLTLCNLYFSSSIKCNNDGRHKQIEKPTARTHRYTKYKNRSLHSIIIKLVSWITGIFYLSCVSFLFTLITYIIICNISMVTAHLKKSVCARSTSLIYIKKSNMVMR